MPRKMRQIALCSALTVKAQNNDIIIVDEINISKPKTREVKAFLNKIVQNQNALVLFNEYDHNLVLGARNLPDSKTLNVNYLNIRDILSYEKLVFSLDTLEFIKTSLK